MEKAAENSNKHTLKHQVLQSLSFPESKTALTSLVTTGLILVYIIYSIIAILETEVNLYQQYSLGFVTITCVLGSALLLEYLLRVWVSDINLRYKDIKFKQWGYQKSIMGLVDLVSAISFIVFVIALFASELMDFARILRLFALLKLTRFSGSFRIIIAVIKRKKEELLIALMLSLILMFFGAIFVYIAEHEAQPDKITNLFSSMWFTAINLFTIGYGDIIPLTPFGKIVSAVISFLGIAQFLLPASVIVAGFLDEIEEGKPPSEECPNCTEIIQKSEFIRELNKKKEEKQSEQTVVSIPPQKRIYDLIQFKFPVSLGQKIVFLFFSTVITLNVLAIMVETNPSLSLELKPILNFTLLLSIIVFTIEYVLRVWCCVASEEEKYHKPTGGRLKYFLSPIAIIDLVFLLALYLMLIFNQITIVVLYLQILRFLVVFKIDHFVGIFSVAGLIFKDVKKEFFTTVILCGIFLAFASTIIYSFEREAQPYEFSSILTTLWMGIITFTTTGFGDVYPITTAGRFATITLAFLGVSLFTLPAGILGSSFFSTMQDYRYYRICPKCDYILSKPELGRKDKIHSE